MPPQSVHGFNSALATLRLVWFQAAAAQRRKNRAHVVRFIGGAEQSVTVRYDVEQRGGRYTTGDDSSRPRCAFR